MELKQWIDLILKDLKRKMQAELKKQGHVMTGSLRDSLDTLVIQMGTTFEGYITGNHYGEFIDKEVTFRNIPSRGYIEGLIRFWKHRRGLSDKAARQAAFATANVHRAQGMPTHNARSFGAGRTGWVTNTLIRNEENILKILYRAMDMVYVKEVRDNIGKRRTDITIKLF